MNTAINSHFARLTRTEVDELSDIVKEWRGSALTAGERNCTHCFLKVLTALGADFIKFKNSPRGKTVLKEIENGTTEEVESPDTGDAEGESQDVPEDNGAVGQDSL